MEIKPSTCLRNEYNTISKLAHETGKPIFITKNGEGDLVIMSIETYEKYFEDLKEKEALLALKESLLTIEAARLNGSPSHSLKEVKEKFKNRRKENVTV